jgi:DNA-binding CsgD family transcriptional regulator
MAQGLSLEAIAKTIGVQLKTVKTYQTKLKKKNQVSS